MEYEGVTELWIRRNCAARNRCYTYSGISTDERETWM